MASEVQICNLALTRLGEARITSLADNTPPAKECAFLYDLMRDDELRAHPWRFAVMQASVAADPTEPDWDYAYRYAVPDGCLRVLEVNGVTDWATEAGNNTDASSGFYVLAGVTGPLELKYIARITDTAKYDPLFVSALAARLEVELNEVRTQSNTKQEKAERRYRDAVMRARSANAFEAAPKQVKSGSWLEARD